MGFGDRGRGFGGGRGFVSRGGAAPRGRGGAGGGGFRGGFSNGRGGADGGDAARRGGFGGNRGGSTGGGYNQKKVFDDSDDEGDTIQSTAPKNTAPSAGSSSAPSSSGKATTPQPAATSTPKPVATVVSADGTELPAKFNNKVFVDGLPYMEPTSGPSIFDQLSHMVDQWRVGKAVHLTKKPGHSFGYLAFRSPQSVDVAIRVLDGKKFLGRALRVQLPRPPKEFDPTTPSFRVRGAPQISESSVQRQVLMSDLPASIAQAEVIREVIKQYSAEMEQRIEMIKMAGKNRKAFVTFVSALDVEPFIELMNGRAVLGRRIAVTRAAAPGSLPFSKVPLGAVPAASNPHRPAAATQASQEADEDEAPAAAPSAAAILGTNAVKKFPMPDLLSATSTAVKLRQDAATAKKAAPTAAAATNASSVVNVRGSNIVFVGNLTEETTEEDIRRHFTTCGKILSCEVLVNPHTHESSGIAKVVYALPAYAQRARAELAGSLLHGAPVRVDREGDVAPTAEDPSDEDEEIDSEPDEETFARDVYGVDDVDQFVQGSDDDEDEGQQQRKSRKGQSQPTKKNAKASAASKKGEVASAKKKKSTDDKESPKVKGKKTASSAAAAPQGSGRGGDKKNAGSSKKGSTVAAKKKKASSKHANTVEF